VAAGPPTFHPMELSPQQSYALGVIRQWLDGPAQVCLIGGYAGTGKTTLAQGVAELVGYDLLYGAFTGKAALRLQQKGCLGAQTIHRLVYLPRMKCQEKLKRLQLDLAAEEDADRRRELQALVDRERNNLSRPEFTLNVDSPVQEVRLLVVDEASMIGRKMGADILSFGTKVLALGDPAQLPPVAEDGFFRGQGADYLLTEIHRQAAGSGVLELATLVREGRMLPPVGWSSGAASVVPRGTLGIADLAEFDQIICGYNRTRHTINYQLRQHLGFEQVLPEEGDRLICLKNDYELGLLNGSQWIVVWSEELDEERLLLAVRPEEGGEPIELQAHRHYFEGRAKELAPWDVPDAGNFDYGYAITCHKAQGSEWDSVLVIDEPVPRDQAWRWRYTAITRAAKEVTVVT